MSEIIFIIYLIAKKKFHRVALSSCKKTWFLYKSNYELSTNMSFTRSSITDFLCSYFSEPDSLCFRAASFNLMMPELKRVRFWKIKRVTINTPVMLTLTDFKPSLSNLWYWVVTFSSFQELSLTELIQSYMMQCNGFRCVSLTCKLHCYDK